MTSEKQGNLLEACQETQKHDMMGHFTWRFLKDLDKKYLEELKGRLTSEYKDEPYARRHAIMNLLGFVHCSLEEILKGVELFQQVLLEDKTNMNAVCNLVHAFGCIRRKREKEKYEQEYNSIMLSDTNMNIVRARALIEKGRAACFTDQHHKQKDIEYAKNFFDEGLKLGKDNTDRSELMDWTFGLAYHLLRLDKKCRNDNILKDKYFEEGIRKFYEVEMENGGQTLKSQPQMNLMKDAEGDIATDNVLVKRTQLPDEDSMSVQDAHVLKMKRENDLCGKAWAFMGVLMNWHKKTFAELDFVLDKHRDFDACKCLIKATEIAPKCGAVLRRAAQEFYEMNKFDDALNYGKKAIEIQPIGFAYYPVGQVYLAKYKQCKDTNNEDKELLNNAIKNFQDAIDRHFKPSYAIRDLAIAYHLKGDKTIALEKFQMAANATGGSSDHRLYWAWAQCLEEMGEGDAANDLRDMAKKIGKYEV